MAGVRPRGGVTRLVEAADDAPDAQGRAVDERDDALRGVTDDPDPPPDALDAARAWGRGDRAQDFAGGKLDDRDARLSVRSDERNRCAAGECLRHRPETERQSRCSDNEVPTVHVLSYDPKHPAGPRTSAEDVDSVVAADHEGRTIGHETHRVRVEGLARTPARQRTRW